MSKKQAKKDGLNPQQEQPFQIQDMGDGRSRLRVQFDITYKGHPGKTPVGESDTEPDMTLRLGQLLERHSRGRHIPEKPAVYFDTEIPTINDLTDVERYRDQLQRRLEETNEFIRQDKLKQDEEKSVKEKQPGGTKGKQLEIQDDPSYVEKDK